MQISTYYGMTRNEVRVELERVLRPFYNNHPVIPSICSLDYLTDLCARAVCMAHMQENEYFELRHHDFYVVANVDSGYLGVYINMERV